MIALDKPTAETSVEELTEIVVERVPARADGRQRAGDARRSGLRRRRRLRDAVGAGGRRRHARRDRAGRGRPRVLPRRHGRHARRDRRRAAAAVGAAGPGRLHRGAEHGGAGGGPRRPASPRTRSSGSAPTSPPARRCRCCRRHAAVPGAGVRGPPARLRQALEAPRRPAPRGPGQRGGRGARRALAGPLRRADLVGVGVRQGAPGARRGPRGLRAHGPLDGGGGLDRLAAVRARDAQRLHGRLQGHPPGRRAIRPRTTCASSTRASRTSSRRSSRSRSCRSARAPAT